MAGNRHHLLVGGSSEARRSAAESLRSPGLILTELNAGSLPFEWPQSIPGEGPRLILINDAEGAFPNRQRLGTRLILTQSTYLVQKWLDLIDSSDVIVIGATLSGLEDSAPEALQGHGPWRHFDLRDPAEDVEQDVPARVPQRDDLAGQLAIAYASDSAEERLTVCQQAVSAHPGSATGALALASALRENQLGADARTWLDQALKLAPQWEAVHYEDGKFWLAAEDMEKAAASFQRASALMPTFSAAFGNLGATLGELDLPDAALEAFTRALSLDPDSITTLNNVGVVSRELGRLDESLDALRRVVSLAPDFVFGHYNLGHSLLLSGQVEAALAAYEEGQRRDPQKNRRQGCRLAVVRLVNGDAEGARRDLLEFSSQAPPGEREDLLLEAYEIAAALTRNRQELPGNQAFLDWIAGLLEK